MKKLFILLLSLSFFLFSCSTTSTSTTSTIAPDADFSKYIYAALGSDLDGGAIIYDSQMQLQNSLISSGYQIIGDTRIGTLSPEEKEKVFVITMGITSTNDKSVCVLNITDHSSGYILASCKGVYGLGWDMEDDQRHAISSAITEMENVIRK